MRHKYATEAIVLARFPHGEANLDILLLTPEFGLLRARAQGVRKQGAKLAAALQTFNESGVSLVRGKDTWRLAGAAVERSWSSALTPAARIRAARVAELMLRLVRGETTDAPLFSIYKGFLEALAALPEDLQDAAEFLSALRLLRSLGLDAGEIPGSDDSYDEATLRKAAEERKALVMRVNRGIVASGL